MDRRPRFCWPVATVLALLLPIAALPAAAQQSTSQAPASPVSTPEDFANAFGAVPCEDSDRLAAVQALFATMGAAPADLQVERFDNDVANLVVVKPGRSAERIVIGAHYDKVDKGCGAVDNWTGVVALAHLYKTLRQVAVGKTLVFVAFGKEEKGLLGSRAMARAIPDAQAAQHCAMVNLDSFGLGPPQVADDISSKPLEKLAADTAKAMDVPFGHARIVRGTSDSASFIGRKIPAISLHGMNRQWTQVLHSDDDQAAKVNTMSVYLGYRLALSMLLRIDESPCDAWR